jgi:hypothetical protein
MRNINSIIFLDVDGPLNTDTNRLLQGRMGNPTSSFKIRLPKDPIINLKRIVDNVPSCKLVLSSKWRLGGTPSPARINLESQLKRYGLSIFSETPFIDFARGTEISVWLNIYEQRTGYSPPYIILDNELNNIRNHKGHIIYCNSNNGLTEYEAGIAISLLNKLRNETLSRMNYV